MLFDSRHDIAPRSLRESVMLIDRSPREDEYGIQALLPLPSGSGSGSGVVAPVYGPFPASVQALSGQVKMDYYQSAEIEAYEVQMRFVGDHFTHVLWRGKTMRVDFVEDLGGRGRWLRVLVSMRALV